MPRAYLTNHLFPENLAILMFLMNRMSRMIPWLLMNQKIH
jgi:hypothetical protein